MAELQRRIFLGCCFITSSLIVIKFMGTLPIYNDKMKDKEYKQYLKQWPSLLSNIPAIFAQFGKYGYKGYLFNTNWGQSKLLPNIVTIVGPITIDINHLKSYKKCLGIKNDINQVIPSAYFHCLCVRSTIYTIAHRPEIPLRLLGAVHFKNSFKIYKFVEYNDNHKSQPLRVLIKTTVHRNVELTEKRDLTFSATNEISIVNDKEEKNELICRIKDTFLLKAPNKYRLRTGKQQKQESIKKHNDNDCKLYKWDNIKSNTAWYYSMLSGDFNPIHLHKYSAILFGFKTNILHGMWSAGNIMQQIINENEINWVNDGQKIIDIETEFKRPLFLPNTPRLITSNTEQDKVEYKLLDDSDKVVIEGSRLLYSNM